MRFFHQWNHHIHSFHPYHHKINHPPHNSSSWFTQVLELHLPLPNHLQPLRNLPLLRYQQWLKILKGHGQIQELLGWLHLYIRFQAIQRNGYQSSTLIMAYLLRNTNKFRLSINLNEVVEEDAVVILFPYTLQGVAGSWYFSLPSSSINSWDAFQEQFLTKFGDDRSTTTLINYLSNLKSEPKEPIK